MSNLRKIERERESERERGRERERERERERVAGSVVSSNGAIIYSLTDFASLKEVWKIYQT